MSRLGAALVQPQRRRERFESRAVTSKGMVNRIGDYVFQLLAPDDE